MLVTEFGISMLVKLVQFAKADLPMLVTEFGISILVRLEQPLNTKSDIEVMLSGILIEVRLLQSPKVPILILVTEFGISILVSPSQLLKPYSPMYFKELGRTMLVIFKQLENA